MAGPVEGLSPISTRIFAHRLEIDGLPMISSISKIRDELADREAIKDCVYLYCRGIDRCDANVLSSVFWPDAQIQSDRFNGPPDEFVKIAIPNLRSHFERCMHLIGNIVVRLDGKRAASESYFYSYQCLAAAGPKRDVIISGRYLDRFERRGDEWRMTEMVVVVDWYRDYPDSADWAPGPLGMAVIRGERAPADRSYALFEL